MVRTGVAAVLGLALATAADARPHKYEIDPEHLSIGFLVDHVGFSKVLGLFRSASGSYVFDEDTATLSELRIVIETASVYTNHRKRDDHLKSADFLNSAEFPRMVFTAKGAKNTNERNFIVEGQLELLGRTQPVSLQVTWNKSGEHPMSGGLFSRKDYAMGVSARGSFRRSEFGMKYGVDNGLVGDIVEIIIEFEAKRK
ncbi:MAG: YceI family protein [Burkholderiaceae bacterium]